MKLTHGKMLDGKHPYVMHIVNRILLYLITQTI